VKHLCHWPSCKTEVAPNIWGCKIHWFRLPMVLRLKILKWYRPGQEIDKKPSMSYMNAAREVRNWILNHS